MERGGQIHRIWPGDAGPEAPVCPGPEGAGENGGHDRRRRQRCAGLKGRGLQRGYGFWKRRGGTGFPGGAPGVQFRLHAFGGIGRKKGGQQHSAFGQPVPGEEHFLLPAVPVLSGVYDHLSAGAFPGVADQYVHHRRAGLLPGAPAQQRGDPGTFPDQRIFEGAACRTDRRAGGRGAGGVWPDFWRGVRGYFHGGHHAAGYCRLPDPV